MKKGILSIALAAVLVAVCLGGCDKDTDTPKPSQPAASIAGGASFDEAKSEIFTSETSRDSAGETQPTTVKADKKNKKNQTASTQPTSKPVQDNIPPDDITGANINPNVGGIQGAVADEINSLSVQEISLNKTELTLAVEETAELSVSFQPSNAAVKTLTISTSNNNATVKASGTTVSITAKKAGECTVTVTSHNGKTASCVVKIDRGEVTDDTVLPHNELCTRTNVNRWYGELVSYCAGLSMTENSSLSGTSIVLRTSSDRLDSSFNAYADRLILSLAEQLEIYTSGNYEEFEFNCIVEPQDGNEFNFIITLNRLRLE